MKVEFEKDGCALDYMLILAHFDLKKDCRLNDEYERALLENYSLVENKIILKYAIYTKQYIKVMGVTGLSI